MTYTVAVVGVGADPDDSGRDGFSMGYVHGWCYEDRDDCDLVACVDLVPEHADAFGERFGLPDDAVFTDLDAMLDAVEPDLVSVCTPLAAHAPVVVDGARSGHVDAIHCEKPMADTWVAARRMAAVADDEGVTLSFNH